jgi:hypothetical protein
MMMSLNVSGMLISSDWIRSRARLRGGGTARAAADAEDVVLSEFDSFFRRAGRVEFPRLSDRNDLWLLLFVLTVRKAIDLARAQGRVSRGAAECARSATSTVWISTRFLASSPVPS